MAVSFSPANDFTLIDCYSKEELTGYIEWLKKQRLVFQIGVVAATTELTLSMEGWTRVQPLPRHGGIPGRCFCSYVVL